MRNEFLLLACLTALGCSSGGEAAANPQATERSRDFIKLEPGSPRLDFLKIETVQESDAASSAQLTGRVTYDEEHTQRVASPIDGRVTQLLVKLGDKVKAGQALLELTSPNVGQLQADAQKALQDLGLAEKAVDRVHKLQADGAISDKEVAQAEAEFKKSKSDVARSTAQLRSLGVSPSDPAVNVALRAQISGTVVERNVLTGQEVRADAAAPLLTVTSLDAVWVLADVYEQDLGLVSEGEQVVIRVPAYPGDGFPGVVGHIGDVVDPTSRTVKIRCIAANKDHRLKPEMFARLELKAKAGQKAIVIPSRSVLNDGELTKVVVATEGNVFRARTIDVGPEVDGRIRVLSNLKAGEKIVTDGALFLKHEIEAR
jgi:cobalt-zinc-cadmium efflux system membrane fusion protein